MELSTWNILIFYILVEISIPIDNLGKTKLRKVFYLWAKRLSAIKIITFNS